MTMTTALISCTVLGLQHGVDWDHVAAISDVTSVAPTTREARRCGLNYAMGHAVTVGLLGIGVIVLGQSLPGTWSTWMQRMVGLTLVLLGGYVFSSLFLGRGPVSRGQAIAALINRVRGARHEGVVSAAATGCYGERSALSLGVLHGIGAETPTQLSMLMIAGNMGGLQGGVVGLTVFTSAMFLSNMALTAAATSIFTVSKLKPVVFRWLGGLTAGYSVWLGVMLMAG